MPSSPSQPILTTFGQPLPSSIELVADKSSTNSANASGSPVSSSSTAPLAPAPAAAAAPAKPTPMRTLPRRLFYMNLIVELVTSLSPLYRLAVYLSNEDESSYSYDDTKSTQIMSVVVAAIVRIAWWLGLVVYQLGWRKWHTEFFVFDNILARGIVFSIAYMGIFLNNDGNWIPVTDIFDFLFTAMMCTNLRTLLKYYPWTYWDLMMYRFMRLTAPLVYLAVGVWYIWVVPSSNSRSLFIFYLLAGINYYHDLYTRTTMIPTPAKPNAAPAAPVPTGKKPGTHKYLYFACLLVEFLSASSPLARLESSQDGNSSAFTAGMSILAGWLRIGSVSYTHLTLPTNREV